MQVKNKGGINVQHTKPVFDSVGPQNAQEASETTITIKITIKTIVIVIVN